MNNNGTPLYFFMAFYIRLMVYLPGLTIYIRIGVMGKDELAPQTMNGSAPVFAC